MRYTRPLWAPPERSQASPASESTERSGWAGMKSNPPTFMLVTVTRAPKPLAPRPSASVFTKIVEGPWPPVLFWYVTMTCPDGPMAMSPKLPPLELVASWGVEKAPTVPRPLTAAPLALMTPLSFQVAHTDPAPAVMVG